MRETPRLNIHTNPIERTIRRGNIRRRHSLKHDFKVASTALFLNGFGLTDGLEDTHLTRGSAVLHPGPEPDPRGGGSLPAERAEGGAAVLEVPTRVDKFLGGGRAVVGCVDETGVVVDACR